MSNKKSKTNPFLWFLFVIVIPGIVAITLTIIILAVAGVNVKEWVKKTGNNIPVISSFITSEEERSIEELENKMDGKITSKDAEIAELEDTVNNLEGIIEQLEVDLVKEEKKSNNDLVDSGQNTEDKKEDLLTSVSASFRKMNNKQAALIFHKLEKDLAVSILEELSNDARGKILEAMDPELAAELMQLFIDTD